MSKELFLFNRIFILCVVYLFLKYNCLLSCLIYARSHAKPLIIYFYLIFGMLSSSMGQNVLFSILKELI